MKKIKGNVELNFENDDIVNEIQYKKQPVQIKENNFLKLLHFLLDKDNVRDYIVIILIFSFIYFIIKEIIIPDVFYTLIGVAVGYYFKGNGK